MELLRQNKIPAIIIVVVALLIGVGAGIFFSNDSNNSTTERTLKPREGESMSITDNGFLVGKKDNEKTLSMYFDYNCESCALANAEIVDSIPTWNNEGVNVEFIPLTYMSYGDNKDKSLRLTNALALVADKYPEKFLDAQTALYTISQGDGNIEGIVEVLETAGVPLTEEDREALNNNAYEKWISEVSDRAREDGVELIPSFSVDGNPLEVPTMDNLLNTIEDALK